MAQIFVTYAARDGARFDRDYYVAQHLPLVEKEWGPSGLLTAQAYFPAKADADVVAIAVLRFRDEDAIAASLASPAAETVMADLAHFTDIAPEIVRACGDGA